MKSGMDPSIDSGITINIEPDAPIRPAIALASSYAAKMTANFGQNPFFASAPEDYFRRIPICQNGGECWKQ